MAVKRYKGIKPPFAKLIHEIRDEQEYDVFVFDKRKSRSMPLNKYYWGVVLREIRNTTGIDEEDLHEFFKDKYTLRTQYSNLTSSVGEEIALSLREIPTGTRKMNNFEFLEYLEKITVWASERGMRIPKPNEIPDDVLAETMNRYY